MFLGRYKIGSLLLCTALCVPLATSQMNGTTNVGPAKTPPSLPTLYRFFLGYQLHLDQKADELKAQGRKGEDLRTHFQHVLGFRSSEFTVIHDSAVRLDQRLKAKDAEIRDAIKAARAAAPKGPFPKGTPLPSPPQRLTELFTERQALIAEEVGSLRKKLPAEDVSKLDQFLQRDFAPAVTVGNLPSRVPQPSMLGKGAVR